MGKDIVSQYLENHAEIEAHHLGLNSIDPVDTMLVIPAYRETPDFIRRLEGSSFSDAQKLLLILVSNYPDNLSKENETTALEYHTGLLNALPVPSWHDDNVSYHRSISIDVLTIHCVGPQALEASRSTGLARKIGADIALSLIALGKCPNKWIFNTDADAILPNEYFSAPINANSESAAVLYPFKHVGKKDRVLEATELYEKRLNSYVEGLRLAGSPYAFHTLGSTIVISAEHYAKARGFPRRNAGEDFYLINKLAKLGEIMSLDFPVIEISARCSDRVPFGTGPAVSALAESKAPLKENIFYSHRVYDALRVFITSAEQELNSQALETLPEEINCAAKYVGLESFIRHVRKQNMKNEQYRQHFHIWFDGFRTLKFIHYLRDNYFPNISDEKMTGS